MSTLLERVGVEPDFARLLASVLMAATGMGVTLPYFQIYLHEARGYDLGLTGAASVALALTAFPIILFSGPVADRWGARRPLVATAAIGAAGCLLMTSVGSVWALLVAVTVLGTGLGLQLPLISTLIGELRPARGQSWAFATEYLVLNVGLAAGSVVGGLVIASRELVAFQAIYVVEAACFAGMALLVWQIRAARPRPAGARPGRAPAGSYRLLLRDSCFLMTGLVVLLVVVSGYAQLQSALPLYLSGTVHLSSSAIGLAFAANTVCVIGLQLPVRRWLGRLASDRLLVVLAGTWGLAWLALAAAAALRAHPPVATGLAIASVAVIGVGETLYSMGVPALVNQIAPDELRGRYNAGSALCWRAGMVLGPVAGDLALTRGPVAYPLVAGILALAIVPVALAMRPLVTARLQVVASGAGAVTASAAATPARRRP